MLLRSLGWNTRTNGGDFPLILNTMIVQRTIRVEYAMSLFREYVRTILQFFEGSGSPPSPPPLRASRLGDEAIISMSGSVGNRFSFTHYPQGGEANGPGVTLLRPLPNPSAPWVTFMGMVSRDCGGPGLALGTLGPVLGEVGTTTATVLVEV